MFVSFVLLYNGYCISAFRWFRDKLCPLEVATSKLMGVDPYSLMTEIAANSVPGANGVTALTCLQGSHGRQVNDATRGTFLGITLATEKADLAHAVLEGIVYEMKDILLMQEEFAGLQWLLACTYPMDDLSLSIIT